jgi:hypothetical protein
MENLNEHTLFFRYSHFAQASIATFTASKGPAQRASGSLNQGIFAARIRCCNALHAGIFGACLRAID